MSFWLRELGLVHEAECTIMLQSKPVAESSASVTTSGRGKGAKSSSSSSSMLWAAAGGSSRDTIRAIQSRAHAISAVFAKLCR